ncbi:MAG: hypothetical protein ACFFBP_21675 [Promethearchaeota archaeon]
MRKKKVKKKRKEIPLELQIKALESFRKDMKDLMGKTIKTMNSTATILRESVQKNINNASINLKSTKTIIDNIKESEFLKKQSKFRILDANDFILM